MRQAVDVLAVFDVGALSPRPIRFKVVERGIKKTVRITDISNIEWLGAGGMTRIAYDCLTVNEGRRLRYKLLYFYHECRWELECSTDRKC
ncbi:MAG: hypothetical protein E7227_05395 [Clostridiales bacterium]|nr:hypothetical protein [Clostridiales bacterium]